MLASSFAVCAVSQGVQAFTWAKSYQSGSFCESTLRATSCFSCLIVVWKISQAAVQRWFALKVASAELHHHSSVRVVLGRPKEGYKRWQVLTGRSMALVPRSAQSQTLFSRLILREINRSTIPFESSHYLLQGGSQTVAVDWPSLEVLISLSIIVDTCQLDV